MMTTRTTTATNTPRDDKGGFIMTLHTINGDARGLLDVFIERATRETNESIADALFYDPDAMRRRALELQRQLEKLDAEAEG